MTINIDEKEFYGLVAQEMSNNIIDTGLMTKALAETEFDEKRSKAIYIKMRVADLIAQDKQQKELINRQELEAQQRINKQELEAQQNRKLSQSVSEHSLNEQRRKVENKKLGIYFLILIFLPIGIFSLYSVFDVWNESRQTKESVSNLIGQIENANKQIQTSDAQVLNPVDASPEPVIPPVANLSNITVAQLFSGAQPLVKQFIDKSADLNNRMNIIPFGSILASTNISTPEGVQQSRQHLNQFKELISERNTNISQYWKDGENYFKNANINEVEKKQALEGFLRGKPNLDRLYGELDSAQLGAVNEATAILEICEQNMGHLTLANNQLQFPNQVALDAYNTHLQNVIAYEQKSTEVGQELLGLGKQSIAENKEDAGQDVTDY